MVFHINSNREFWWDLSNDMVKFSFLNDVSEASVEDELQYSKCGYIKTG